MRIPTAVTGEAETAETATRGAGTRRTTVVTALTWALLLIGALLTPGPALAQRAEDSAAPLPPKLDVEAALAALETEQIYRAPGAVAYLDEELIRAELTDDMRVLVAPFTGPYGAEGHYANSEEYRTQVFRPLRDWAEDRGLVLIRVEGLLASSNKGVSAVASDLDGLRRHLGQYDVTSSVWTLVQHAKGSDTDAEPPHPMPEWVDPTPQQTAELVERLRRDRVYNAPGREDPFQGSLDLIRESTGFTLRVVAFPPVEPGEPMVDYAPALAEHFPDDVILVAYGDWLEIAGPHPVALSSARNYAYGRYQQGPYRAGMVLDDRIGTVLSRADELLTQHPFGRPQPKTVEQLITELAPWLLGGSALVLGGVPLAREFGRRMRSARTEREAFRYAKARAFAAIAELGEELLAHRDDPAPYVAAAAERHAAASALFEQATTSAAMKEVHDIADKGSRSLRKRAQHPTGPGTRT